MHGIVTTTASTKAYIRNKAKVLKQLGLTNKDAVKMHLTEAVKEISDPLKREMKIDRIARDMISQFFDGSREFVAES